MTGHDEQVATIRKELDWLDALRLAEAAWQRTDYRTPEYARVVDAVLNLIRADYIVHAAAALTQAQQELLDLHNESARLIEQAWAEKEAAEARSQQMEEALREFLDEFDVAEGRPPKYDLLRAAAPQTDET